MKKSLKLLIVTVLSVICLTCMSTAVVFAEGVTGSKEEGVTGEVTLSSFETIDGAQIRLTAPVGIRFISQISVADLEKLPTNAQFGTLVIGTDKLGANELTFETDTVENVVAEYWYNDSTDTTKIFTAVIGGTELGEDFPADYYAMNLTARGYVKYTDTAMNEHVIYAETTSRSLSYVAASALANGEDLGDKLDFFKTIADKALAETISFESASVTIPAGYSYDLDGALVGTSGIPAKYVVSPSVTVSNGKFIASQVGTYNVTATVGSKSCSTSISVSDVEKELVANIYDMQLFAVSAIKNAVDITVPEIDTADIDGIYGGTYVIKDSSTITVTLEDTTSVGERSLIIQVGDKLYSLTICVADEIISTAEQFTTMRNTRIVSAKPSSTKYYALNADIQIPTNKLNGSTAHPVGESMMYFDIFDGRGHVISPDSTATAVWNNGLFCNLVDGAGVKNLILKDFMVRGNQGGGCDGAVAYQLSNGSFIDNIVVINPVLRDASGYATGLLVGRIYQKSTISNCLVLDFNSLNGVVNGLANGYDATTKLYNGNPIGGLVGNAAYDYDLTNIKNSYALTKNTSIGVLRANAEVLDGTLFTSFEELLEGIDDFSAYKLLENDGFTISVKDTEIYSYPINNIVSAKDAELFEKNSDNEYELTVPSSVSVSDINVVSQASIISSDSVTNKITLKFDNAIRGEVEVRFGTSSGAYSIFIVVADEIVTSGTGFKSLMYTRMFNSSTSKNSKGEAYEGPKYIVLGNDIQINTTKYDVASVTDNTGNFFNGISYVFKDTFDGRYNTISGNQTSTGDSFYTMGIFNTISANGHVKNLIVKNPIMQDSNNWEMGTIATRVQDGGILENCVVINPVAKTAGAANSAYGFLVNRTYTDSTIVRNNLVIDAITTAPSDYRANTYDANGKFISGNGKTGAESTNTIQLNGLIGIIGGSTGANSITNNYCISIHGYNGACFSSYGTTYKLNEYMVASINDFFEKAKINSFSEFSITAGVAADEILANKVLIEDVYSMKATPVIKASDITDNKITVNLPNTIDVSKIVSVSNCASFESIVEGNKLVITLNSTSVRGDINFAINVNGYFNLAVCIADEIVTSGTQFKELMYSRLFDGSSKNKAGATFDEAKYIALGNDIQLNTTKYTNTSVTDNTGEFLNGTSYFFKDTFDGRGNVISGNQTGNAFYTQGLFCTISTGGHVMNLIVKNPIIQDSNNWEAGTIATRVQSGGILENNVIINPYLKASAYKANAFGLLVNRTYAAETIVRNNLVIDGISSVPNFAAANTYDENGKFVSSEYVLNGLVGIIGGSTGANSIKNNYCISSHGYNGACYSALGTDYRLNDCVVTLDDFFDLTGVLTLGDFSCTAGLVADEIASYFAD